MVWPEKMRGAMEMTIENLITPASTDQNSRRLGRFSPVAKIKGTARRDVNTASMGFMDRIVCTFSSTFT